MPTPFLERRIYLIRGQKVMLDSDLAEIYQVLTKNLNKAVARNRDRFPADFRFQLTREEARPLRFQIGTSNAGRGGRRYMPYAFTDLCANRVVSRNLNLLRRSNRVSTT